MQKRISVKCINAIEHTSLAISPLTLWIISLFPCSLFKTILFLILPLSPFLCCFKCKDAKLQRYKMQRCNKCISAKCIRAKMHKCNSAYKASHLSPEVFYSFLCFLCLSLNLTTFFLLVLTLSLSLQLLFYWSYLLTPFCAVSNAKMQNCKDTKCKDAKKMHKCKNV